MVCHLSRLSEHGSGILRRSPIACLVVYMVKLTLTKS
jgi:hypothetical protein